MGENRRVDAKDLIGSIINTGSINNSTIIQISAAVNCSFGFELYTLGYFKDHKSTDKDFEDWQNGFPFEIEAIKEKKEFRRIKVVNEIETRLESNRSVLMVGESGSSKSTVLKEIMCDYLDNEYLVLYNHGTEISSSDFLIKFIEGLLKGGNKVLVAMDDAHNISSAPIFYVMDQLSRYQVNQNLRFLLSARLPDFDRFVYDELSRVQETYRQAIRKFTGPSAEPDFKYKLPAFSKDDIKDFIMRYGDLDKIKEEYTEGNGKLSEADIDEVSQRIFEDSKGVAIMVKFSVLGQGLEEDVAARYDRYIEANAETKAWKIKTMLVCSLLRLSDFDVSDDLLVKMQLYQFALALDRATLYRHSGLWDTVHRSWGLSLLTYMFNESNEKRVYENKKHLWNAFDSVLMTEDEKAIDAFLRSIVFDLKGISLEEVKFQVSSHIESSTCHLSPQTASTLWYGIGFALFAGTVENQRFEEALDCYTKAVEKSPNNEYYWEVKGNVLESWHRLEEALECYAKAVEINPNNAYYWKIKGDVLVRLNRLEGSLECYAKAVEINPNNAYYWKIKGDMLASLNRFKEALDCYNKAVEKNPTDSSYQIAKGDILKSLDKFGKTL